MNETLTKELLRVKEKIDNAIKEKYQIEGKLESLFDQLNTTFSLSLLEKAEEKLNQLEKEIQEAKEIIEKELKKLHE